MTRNKQGVSLIVLVITIIVMIILAGAVIISLSNTGIIGKANNAVSESNLKEVQQLATLAWSEAYIDNLSVTDETTRLANIERAVNSTLTNQGIDLSKYDIDVTRKGVSVSIKTASGDNNTGDNENNDNPGTGDNGGSDPDAPTPPTSEPDGGDSVQGPMAGPWFLERYWDSQESKYSTIKISNGTNSIDVGATVNYMPEGVGPEGSKYTGGWKILGTDNEGRVLIISNDAINGEVLTLGGRDDLENAHTILQNTVNGYKDGNIGIDVRCVKLEDILTLIAEESELDNGVDITFSWKSLEEGEEDDYKVVYSYVQNGETVTGEMAFKHEGGFYYYNEITGRVEAIEYNPGTTIATLRTTTVNINLDSYLYKDSAVYEMLYSEAQGEQFGITTIYYLLDTRSLYSSITPEGMYFYSGLMELYSQYIDSSGWVGSVGAGHFSNNIVRAVVTLDSNIILTESTTLPGTYDVTLGE